MDPAPAKSVFFKRSHFATQLPADALYSPSHYWLQREPAASDHCGPDTWRIGFSKFAVRMLGDLVDQGFEVQPGGPIKPGAIIGWIEGFKAISDIYCVVDGTFCGANPSLHGHLELINDAPYTDGWLYRATGTPDTNCMPVTDYVNLLHATIDRMLAQQKDSPPTP